MGAVPQHPFFLRVIESLQTYKRNWRVPYITVMYTTGPLFLSAIWTDYIRAGPKGEDRVRILMPDEYNKHAWSFFDVTKGNSWHGKDAHTIFWMGKHWMLVTVGGFVLAGIFGSVCWLLLTAFRSCRRSYAGNKKFRPKFWRRSSSQKADYELLARIA